MLRSALAVAALCLSISVSAQPLREQLMKDGRIDDEDVRPKFVTLTSAEVKEQIQVSLAALDEADQLIPAVEVRLPAASNIAYATCEFDEPSVRDSRGATVAIERQSGLLDRYTNSVQLRLFAPGQEKPARFATVKGHVIRRTPREPR